MEKIIDKIINKENLLWAWNKTNNAYCVGDIWFDTLELARFEANLDSELDRIALDIEGDCYKLHPIEPIPFPKKKGEDENGKPKTRIRQAFYISVRDQVTWMAVVNIIGPMLDFDMPSWSFGNRLHRSVWYDPDLKIGWYRSSNKNFFRTWKQSWPLYRHSIGLTIKKMVNNTQFTSAEEEGLQNNDILPIDLKLPYLTDGYWPETKAQRLYWASIDLERFYPRVNLGVIEKQILSKINSIDKSEFAKLLKSLLTFRLHIDSNWQGNELDEVELKTTVDIFTGIPTGLFVAGFLANVAMLKIDRTINTQIINDKKLAIFRYVDDHVILGYKPEDILEWILLYQNILSESGIGVSFNSGKTEPKEFGERFENIKKVEDITEEALTHIEKCCRLDPEYPVPLMTQTLAKVSNIADSDIDFLTEAEEKQLLADLEHLLLTDFPDHELRCDTRVSFASNMLARIISNKRADYTAIYLKRKELYSQIAKLCKMDEKLDRTTLNSYYNFNNKAIRKPLIIRKNCNDVDKQNMFNEISKLNEEINSLKETIDKELFTQKKHIFKLLLKSVKENHDKTKLWRRVIDYGYNTQITKSIINDIFFSIKDTVKQGDAHKLSEQYLYSIFVLVISDRMMRAMGVISNDESSLKSRERAESFLEACTEYKFVNMTLRKSGLSDMFYYQRSFNIFKATVGSALFIRGNKKSKILQDSRILNWRTTPDIWFDNNNIDTNDFMSLLLFRVNNKFALQLSDNWQRFSSVLNSSTIKSPTTNYVKSIHTDYVNLYEWMDWCQKYSECNSFDLRLSEWMAIRVILKCIELDKSESNFSLPDEKRRIIIRPDRYLIPQEWTSPDYVVEINKEEEFGRIIIDESVKDEDSYYIPSAIVKSYKRTDSFYALYGYATLLNQLLYRDFSFPWIWQLKNYNVLYPKFINKTTANVAVSSYTQAIITSCLNSRNRESFSLKGIVKILEGVSPDWSKDSPSISCINTLQQALNFIVCELVKNMVSVKNNQYRQLTPISMIDITNSNNPFEITE